MSAVVGRDAAVGVTGVEAAVEIKQQRVEVLPLSLLRLQRSGGAAGGSSGSSVAGRAVYVGGAGNSVGSAGVDSSQPLGQAGPVSGVSSAGATAATAPSAYSATWSGWIADSLSSTPSAGAQPWRQVKLGAAQGPSAGGIPVDQRAECLRANISLP